MPCSRLGFCLLANFDIPSILYPNHYVSVTELCSGILFQSFKGPVFLHSLKGSQAWAGWRFKFCLGGCMITTTVTTMEIFYSFQCPYSYLILDQLYEIGKKYNVQVLWQPYVIRNLGQPGKGISPERASYIKEDAERIAKKIGMPINFPNNWPEEEFDADRATRGALVASERHMIWEYNVKMFYKWWGSNEDPNNPEFMRELCEDLDVEVVNDFAGRMSSSEIRNRARGNYRRAKELKVFDTPMILINNERFLGLERLEYIVDRLEELGLRNPDWF